MKKLVAARHLSQGKGARVKKKGAHIRGERGRGIPFEGKGHLLEGKRGTSFKGKGHLSNVESGTCGVLDLLFVLDVSLIYELAMVMVMRCPGNMLMCLLKF